MSDSLLVHRQRPAAVSAARTRRVDRAALLLGLVVVVIGTLFAVAVPKMWGPDEPQHFYRAYQVAHGGFLPHKVADLKGAPVYGGRVPSSVLPIQALSTRHQWNQPQRGPVFTGAAAHARAEAGPIRAGTKVTKWFTNTAAYAPPSYLPAAAALRLVEAGDGTIGQAILAMRLAGVLSYALLVTLAVLALRRHRLKWLVVVVAALPSAIFQASVVSADTVTNGVSILFLALAAKGVFLRRPLAVWESWLMLATALVLPLLKPTYVALLPLLFLVPAGSWALRRRRVAGAPDDAWTDARTTDGRPTDSRSTDGQSTDSQAAEVVAAGSSTPEGGTGGTAGPGEPHASTPAATGRRRWAGPAAAVVSTVVALALTALWAGQSSGTGNGMGLVRGRGQENSVRPADQLQFLLEHPGRLAGIAARTAADYGWRLIEELFSQTGYTVQGSAVAAALSATALLLAAGMVGRLRPGRVRLAVAAAVLLGGISAVFVVLYLAFDPVGLYEVQGVQGRYFVPLALLAALVALSLVPFRLDLSAPGTRRRVVATIAVLVTLAPLLALAKYVLLTYVTVS